MTDREAMKLALEALQINLPIAYVKNGRGERFPCFSDDPLREIKTREAITALRQALEQREQEPVACKHNRYSVDVHEQTGTCYDCGAEGRMRFVVDVTAPPKREFVGLTDDEIAEGAKQSWVDKQAFESAVWWAEKKLREKNGF